jgi:protein-tyrosine-phosphatase
MDFETGPESISSLAGYALQQLYEAREQGIPIDSDFIDQVSSLLHERWLQENAEKGISEEKRHPYGELSDEDKNQYRLVVKMAQKALDKNRSEGYGSESTTS